MMPDFCLILPNLGITRRLPYLITRVGQEVMSARGSVYMHSVMAIVTLASYLHIRGTSSSILSALCGLT